MIETLKRTGYVEGVNLFAATYDWRLNPGPVETLIDGKINRSAAAITDDTYEYAVDQLGFWLKEAIKGWKSQFPGIPESDIPKLDSVDIVAHSTGGLVARSYIQSDAYGKSFSFEDKSGKVIETNLPKVNNFFMLGVPNRGSSLPWNPLNNNFIAGPGIRIIGAMIKAAYKKVKKGKTILLSGRDDLQGVIAPPPAGTELNPIEFIEQYVPTFRSLLATYPFIDVLSDNPSEALKTIESIAPSKRNTFLLDLNNGFDSMAGGGDPNLFAERVNQVSVIYGTNKDTRDAVRERDQPDFEDPLLPFFPNKPKATIRNFGASKETVPEGMWFRDEVGLAAKEFNFPTQGNDAVPLLSAIGTFLGDTRENIKQSAFTKGDNTNDTVDHTGLVSNIDVQKLILETLGVSLDDELISTELENTQSPAILNLGAAAYSNASSLSTVLFDPVEGFLVDGSGRRLGYSKATGAVTEIPNSVWLGEEDGLGWFEGSVKGPFQLQLTGLDEEYFVSISLITEAGLGGIEVEGFLAKGEQKTFNIPINNAPTLDLNGAAQGIDFSTTGTLGASIALVNPSLGLADSDSSNLQGATLVLTNPQNGTQESLKATSVGNITVAYDPATHTLTFEGTDTIANYQQVLKTVTYTNTATTLNTVPREIAFVVDDGVEFNNLSAVAKTTLTLTAPPPLTGKIIKGTRRRDILTGTEGNDTIIGFQDGDRLTGKGGNDRFVYKTLKDGTDTITDFEVGKDKIVLTEVLKSIGYKGSAPLGDGSVGMTSLRGNTFLHIDPDGLDGKAPVRMLAQVTGVTEAALDQASNFVF